MAHRITISEKDLIDSIAHVAFAAKKLGLVATHQNLNEILYAIVERPKDTKSIFN